MSSSASAPFTVRGWWREPRKFPARQVRAFLHPEGFSGTEGRPSSPGSPLRSPTGRLSPCHRPPRARICIRRCGRSRATGCSSSLSTVARSFAGSPCHLKIASTDIRTPSWSELKSSIAPATRGSKVGWARCCLAPRAGLSSKPRSLPLRTRCRASTVSRLAAAALRHLRRAVAESRSTSSTSAARGLLICGETTRVTRLRSRVSTRRAVARRS